jgi:4-alpha-glucanotransferase
MEESLRKLVSNTASAGAWKRVGPVKRAGVLVPLFSVYTKQSLGIGDISCIPLLVEWCRKTGNSVLQLLPMNEVGGTFCPYDSLSSFALEPVYICVDGFTSAGKEPLAEKILHISKVYPADSMHVDYQIKKEKIGILREIFRAEGTRHAKAVRAFARDNRYWLSDFALFKVLKEHHGQMAWWDWEEKYRMRDARALEEFSRSSAEAVDFEIWLQYQAFVQLTDARAYAAKKGVLLKGDLPILVSRDSADVWAHPEFFKMDSVAGAPPDMYCAKGQRWGTPTYDWERIAADGFTYLKEKLAYAGHFYDMLRVDHVVGLFRIWSIPYNEPAESKGLGGTFDPVDQRLWKEHGERILSVMVEHAPMLLCAEDLGVIPQECPQVLRAMGIPGNDVQRWAKDWNVRHDFLSPAEYREMSVAMLSTHDTTNWAAWWEYEAGTVDEGLFVRKCQERGIDLGAVREILFDAHLSRHGRLRWRRDIATVDILVSVLSRRHEEVRDFIELYENSYCEKEKLFGQMGLTGPMREKADREIIKAALRIPLASSAILNIHTLIDWLYIGDFFAAQDTYFYRINTPGTVSVQNWSLKMPVSIEALLRHRVCGVIRKMIEDSGR